VEKRGVNTRQVAAVLAEKAECRIGEVGYAGLKDRHALVRQWFSVPGPVARRWEAFRWESGAESFRVLRVSPAGRKLRPGHLLGNRFRICLRAFSGPAFDEVARRAREVAQRGVPNYFGAQRFGYEGHNVERAAWMFETGRRPRSRALRGIYLSAARAYLFNVVLGMRVAGRDWERALPGEALLASRNSRPFLHYRSRELRGGGLEAALRALTVHPTGPLWGAGPPGASGFVAALEQEWLAPFAALRLGLESAGLHAERRALRMPVEDLELQSEEGALVVSFRLPAGSYATSVLRELVTVSEPRRPGKRPVDGSPGARKL